MLIAILVRAQSTRNNTQAEPARAVAAKNSVHAEFTLRDGIPIRLRLKRNLSSSNATVGQFVDFEVLEEVTVNGVVVIPKGGKAMGSVTEAIPKKRMRRAGRLEIVLDYVRLTDRETAAVRAVEDAGSKSNAAERPAGIVTTGLLFWPGAPFVLFAHGKDITIPKGAEVTAYVNGDLKLNATKFAQAAGAIGSAPTSASTPALSSTAPVPPSAVLGSIEVHSSPESADVYADGSFIGNAPATLKLSAGHHSIKVTLSGYEEWSRELSVLSGSEAYLTATLKRLD
jgi:hypothetical protein